jgi:DNA repair protein RecO (recombination protein O)
MRVEQQPAFVLHGRPYRETSLLLECLTRDHGRIGLVARGVRKEKSRLPRALLQPLTPISLGWTGSGELATLTAAEARAEPLQLSGETALCGLYLNELMLRLTVRQDAYGELFCVYEQTLERLAGGDAVAWTLRRFERDLLEQLGYGLNPGLDAQAQLPVQADGVYGYRHELGAVRWKTAADGPKVSGAALLALAADRKPADPDLPPLRRWMRAVIAAHLDGGELQAWKLMSDVTLRQRD